MSTSISKTPLQTKTTSRRDVLISKALSYLLRHGAEKENLAIDNLGYVPIVQILQHQRLKSFKTTREDIERIVAENDKQRFSINAEEDTICANQGHSLSSVSGTLDLLTKAQLAEMAIYHGTYKKKLPLILGSGGLSRMNRNHIHFTCEQYHTISGIRNSANCLIYIDTDKCIDEYGLQFFKSANNVILCAGNEHGIIPVECFAKVVDLKGQPVKAVEDEKEERETGKEVAKDAKSS